MIPMLSGGVTRRLKCTVYMPGDFDAVTTNGQPIKLGKGTFGQVALMRLRNSERPLIAVKSCNSVLVSEQDVLREVKAMQVVQDHWAFPKLVGIIRSRQLSAIALEFIGDPTSMMGLTVADAIRCKQRMPFKRNWIWIALDIAKGLAHLHSKGYLHCDLKTNNILLYHNGQMWRPKIIDMGQACRTVDAKGPLYLSRSEQQEIFKRFPHVPREVIAGTGGYTVEGDIYSLGYVLSQVAEVCSLRTKLRGLGDRCFNARPASRPSLTCVIQELTSLAVNGC